MQRAQSFLAGRQTLGAPATARDLLAARAQHLALLQGQTGAQGFTPLIPPSTVWQAVGPAQIASSAFGNITGRITGIAIDPADATGNTVYIGTTGGGVWKSVNAAGASASVSFAPLTDTLPVFNGSAALASLSIGAISVQPGGTRVVLAGTGDPNDALDSYYGSGLLRSADSGQTWSLIQSSLDGAAGNHSFIGEGFAGFAWSTASPNLIVAAVSQAAEGTITNAGTSSYSVLGLYYSTDAGVTWQMATISDGSQVIQSAQSGFTSYSGNAATAVVWNPVRQRFYAAVRFHGYYQSADGIHWTRLANQPGTRLTTANCPARPNAVGNASCPIFRGALAVNPVTGDTFALTVDAGNLDQGLWQDACVLSGTNCASSTVAFARQIVSVPVEVSSASTTIAHGDYNLTLAAVPTGTGATADTLLFVGATDIFRCVLSSCTLRNTTNSSNGCATPAMVAPAQHAIASLALPTGATQPLLFFGNDGGLWRSSDGVNEQGSACAATDAGHFQNLNGGLGSLAEIVHFSQSPADGNTFLAGVGAMGTAATTAATTQSAWPQISAGEGGYNAIDATNPLNWYIATGAGVSADLCTLGGACTAADFAPAVGPAQTASDAALVDAPFLLDPGLQSNLIVGTCRIWRGPGSGGASWSPSNLLSPMLDGVAEPECLASSGAVRSLEAGGAVNGGGSAQFAGSEVIYAGLAGSSDGGGVKGGHLFSTTAANTASSATAWTDMWLSPVTNDPSNNPIGNPTGSDAQFNPGDFDISSITVDAHDTTGATVYATVMGFSGNGISEPHVYRSADGGAHWANISSNLPNAPANSLLVDPNSANTVYVALDTGVYVTTAVSTCATATVNCWSIYGTALPNAPVTQLAAVTGAAAGAVTGLLRAGTYGRGIWQIPLATATLVQQPEPAIQLSATGLTFAAQQAQTVSTAQSITVTNTGNADLAVSQIAVAGDFIETDDCMSAAVTAGNSCTVQVSFLPSTTGARTGTLTIYANVTGGQATATLSGTGLAPAAITLNPLAVTFAGDTLIGTTSAAMNINVTNTGGVSTPLQTPVLTGDFAVSNNTCGTSLAANTACAIAITFTPTVSGARNGTFAITDSAGTQTAALSGTGAAAATDTLAPIALTFAPQTIGTTSAVQAVTITNNGDVSLLLTNVSASGEFTAVNNCGAFLVAHNTCTISVAYVPRSTGAAAGTLSITDVNRMQSVALSGSGLAPAGVSLTPFTLGFGNVGVGHVSAPQVVTLTNNGGSPLTISSVIVSGDYVLAGNTCPSTLAASDACAFTIRFAPIGSGLRAGVLTVTDNAAASPQTVPLTGTGVEFGFTAGSSTSQTVSSTGGSAGYGLLITPASGLSGTLALSCTGAPVNASCNVDPATADLAVSSTLIQVDVSTAVKHSAVPGPGSLWLALLVPLALLRRRPAALMVFCVLLSGCSAGRLIPADSTSAPVVSPTPPGTYTLTVTATDSISLAQHSVQLTLIVQ